MYEMNTDAPQVCVRCNRVECTESRSNECNYNAAEYWHLQWMIRSAELLGLRETHEKLLNEDSILRQFQTATALLAKSADASTAKNSVSIAFSWDGVLPNLPFCEVEVFMYRPNGLKAQARITSLTERIERAEAAYSSLDTHWKDMLVERTTLLTTQKELQARIAELEQQLARCESGESRMTEWVKERIDG